MRTARSRPRTPIAVLIPAVIAGVFFTLPLIGLAARIPWSRLGELATTSAASEALRISLMTSVAATAIATAFGLPLAWVLARTRFPGRRLVRAICTLSMVLPPVVGGVALLAAFGRRGLIGTLLNDWFGVRLPFSMPAVVIAQVFVAMPFLVLTVESALVALNPTTEETARTLGASPWYLLTRVTIPSIRPAIVSGMILTWARALGEFGATITFAGNFPGTTRTLPIATYLALESDIDLALLMSLILVVVSLTVLVSMRQRWTGALGDPR
jgi:molybdate transport system permease protein